MWKLQTGVWKLKNEIEPADKNTLIFVSLNDEGSLS